MGSNIADIAMGRVETAQLEDKRLEYERDLKATWRAGRPVEAVIAHRARNTAARARCCSQHDVRRRASCCSCL